MLEFKFLIGPEVAEAELQIPAEQRVPWPIDSIIMYAMEDGKIVGRMGVMSIKFIEGTWVDESKRSTSLAFRMMKQMEAVLRESLGSTHAMALVYDEQPEVGDYLARVGFERFPVIVYSKELVEKEV